MRPSMPLLLAIAALMALATLAMAANEPYQEIRVTLRAEGSLRELFQNVELELMGFEENSVRVLSRPSITEDLIAQGWTVEVIHADLEGFYASRLKDKQPTIVWHTYEDMFNEMALLHSQYPNITTAPFSIGQTGEGRDIWAIKVSDNPDVDEDEPEVLHDGMHHAREIMTVEMLLYFSRYLCENYGTDPTATYLVDNRETWFVPILNVDGFVYNEMNSPGGGGMWRKNRRYNGGDCYGVDNNRNYPYEWGGAGSSPDSCSEVYRGPGPASEPETQALMNLVNSRQFVTHDSWHSVAGMILMPWGYTLDHTPDDEAFRRVVNMRAGINHYVVGQPPEILYQVHGGSIDWTYGEQTTKPKIFSYSTEIGGSGFWPDPSEKAGLLAENLQSIIILTQAAGPFPSILDFAVSGGDGNGRIDPGETVDLLATVRSDGIVAGLTGVEFRLRCDDPYVALLNASSAIGTMGVGESSTNDAEPFVALVESSCPIGREITFTLVVDADGGVHSEAPFVFTVGDIAPIAAYDFEEPEDAWIQDATHSAAYGAFVRVDPVGTLLQPENDTTADPGVYAWITGQNPLGLEGVDDVDLGTAATRSPDIDLSAHARVRLSMNYFHGQGATGGDPTGDAFLIEVSPNAGGSWVNLVQIGDVATEPVWRSLAVNLEDYIPLTSQVRIRVRVADGMRSDIIEGGIDDVILVDAGIANLSPSAPSLLSPPDGATGVPELATLEITNATDLENDPLTYGFRIYSDPELTQIVQSTDGVPQGTGGTTSWTVPTALPPGILYWRAFAADAYQRGLYAPAASFAVPDPADAQEPTIAEQTAVVAGPNPAPDGITIRYLVPATTTSRLGVYDPQGRLVRSLKTVPSASGWREVVWDARDGEGRKVPSGSYWVQLWTPGEARTIRVITID
jgi:hypothetical protein